MLSHKVMSCRAARQAHACDRYVWLHVRGGKQLERHQGGSAREKCVSHSQLGCKPMSLKPYSSDTSDFNIAFTPSLVTFSRRKLDISRSIVSLGVTALTESSVNVECVWLQFIRMLVAEMTA